MCAVKGVMPGYHAFHDVPCSASSFLLTDILRREWGFDGMVVSDYGAVINVHKVFGYAPTPEKAGAVSLQAGSSSRDIHLSAPVAIEGASRILPQRTHFVSEDRT